MAQPREVVALGLGPNVDVMEPTSLRKRVAAGHAAAIERAVRREAGGPRGAAGRLA